MAIHEALAILDPTEQTPHDIYAILTYAAAAHPDVGQMIDRFASTHRSRVIGEQQQRDAAAAMGAEPRLVPMIPAPAPVSRKRRTGRPHGSYTRPKEVIEAERAAMEAKRAAWKARREARQAQKVAEARKKRESAKDKDFTYLVRRAEEELGRTGKYDNEMKPKPTSSRAKRKQMWLNKATGVKDTLIWMMKQLTKEMFDDTRSNGTGVVVIEVTYGTKKNALVAMREIIHAVIVDGTEVGMHLRENWLAEFEDTFGKAVKVLSDEELATLGNDKKWVKDLKALINIMRRHELGDETLKEILSIFAPTEAGGQDFDSEESVGLEDEVGGTSSEEQVSRDESSEEEEDEQADEQADEQEDEGEGGEEDEEEDEEEDGEEDEEEEEDGDNEIENEAGDEDQDAVCEEETSDEGSSEDD